MTGSPLKLYSGIYSNYFRKWFLELGKVTRFRLATMYQIECNTLHQTPFFVYSISHIKSPLIGCLICIRIGSVMDAVRAASMSSLCAVMGSWSFFFWLSRVTRDWKYAYSKFDYSTLSILGPNSRLDQIGVILNCLINLSCIISWFTV